MTVHRLKGGVRRVVCSFVLLRRKARGLFERLQGKLAAAAIAVPLCLTVFPMQAQTHDVVLRNGTIYDGSGSAPLVADVAVSGDKIAEVGSVPANAGRVELDVRGLAVVPGFINMLSWACESLIADGRAQSDVRQGVTLEVMGEGESFGPLTPAMKEAMQNRQGDLKYMVEWNTLGEYLNHLVRRGVSVNIASFVGATTVRIHEIGYSNRRPTQTELERMTGLVKQAMEEGALGVSSALIYAPGCYARTDELIALAKVAAASDGVYISHLRSEGDRLLEALDEFITIAREARCRSEIYHFKVAGQSNWHKLDEALSRIESARAAGLKITANMYTYTAAGTGLNATMPTWVQEGGFDAWLRRLRDPNIRARLKKEMNQPGKDWENYYLAVGSPQGILLAGFRNEKLKHLTGLTLAQVAATRKTSPEDTIFDLVLEDGSRVDAVFFLISEENLRRQLRLPWVSFGSDEAAFMPDGIFLRSMPHPRAYGNFARLLGKYVRDEKLIPLQEAIHRLTGLPAENLKLDRRGRLQKGFYADVVVFDPATVQDFATYTQPHQYSSGVKHVWVNGVQVIKDGNHTGAKPGRVVRGPGYKGPTPR
jgi:N-acyl-D-amino-acid deacylase